MNCPHCRKRIHYERELSSPQGNPKRLVYFCAPDETLFIFEEISVKSTRRGVLVMKLSRLRRDWCYTEQSQTRTGPGGGPQI